MSPEPRAAGGAPPPSLARARELVSPVLRSAVHRLDPRLARVAGYHLGWVEPDGSPTQAGAGKSVRAALAVLSAEAVGAAPQSGVPAAVAVELVHNFSLLHDDLMDRDEQRRHRATAWTVFGPSAAILTGDALLGLAVDVLAEGEGAGPAWAVRALSAATERLMSGQAADLDFEARTDVGLDECLAMASDKTGALLACSASLGAVLSGGSPATALALAEVGGHLGLAFQMVDDLLGIWGQPSVTGKPARADLRARKKSLPVVVALTAGTAAAQHLRTLYESPDEMTDDDLEAATALVEEAGGRDQVSRLADEHVHTAHDLLDRMDVPERVRHELGELLDYTTRRDR